MQGGVYGGLCKTVGWEVRIQFEPLYNNEEAKFDRTLDQGRPPQFKLAFAPIAKVRARLAH